MKSCKNEAGNIISFGQQLIGNKRSRENIKEGTLPARFYIGFYFIFIAHDENIAKKSEMRFCYLLYNKYKSHYMVEQVELDKFDKRKLYLAD